MFRVLRGVVWYGRWLVASGVYGVRIQGGNAFNNAVWYLNRKRFPFLNSSVEVDGPGLLEVVNSKLTECMPVLRHSRTDANGLVIQHISQSSALIPDVSHR